MVKLKSLLNEQVKISKVSFKIDTIDEWVEFVVKLQGKWKARDKDEILKILFDPKSDVGKKFEQEKKKVRGKKINGVSIPIPEESNDFDDWNVYNNSAEFIMSDR